MEALASMNDASRETLEFPPLTAEEAETIRSELVRAFGGIPLGHLNYFSMPIKKMCYDIRAQNIINN